MYYDVVENEDVINVSKSMQCWLLKCSKACVVVWPLATELAQAGLFWSGTIEGRSLENLYAKNKSTEQCWTMHTIGDCLGFSQDMNLLSMTTHKS